MADENRTTTVDLPEEIELSFPGEAPPEEAISEVPEDGSEVTAISSSEAVDQAERDQQELTALNVQEKVELPEPTPPIDTDLMADLDIEDDEDPQIAADKETTKQNVSAIDAESREIDEIFNKLLELADAATQAQIAGIKATFGRRSKQLIAVNRAALAAVKQFGIRGGTARFAALINIGIVSGEERAGIVRLGELDALEASAIAEANSANAEKKFDIMIAKMGEARNLRREKRDELKKLGEKMRERDEEIQQIVDKGKRQSAMIDAFKVEGIKDATEMFEFLNPIGADGKRKFNVDFDEIADFFDFVGESANVDPATVSAIQANPRIFTQLSQATREAILPLLDSRTIGLINQPVGKDDDSFREDFATARDYVQARLGLITLEGVDITVDANISDEQLIAEIVADLDLTTSEAKIVLAEARQIQGPETLTDRRIKVLERADDLANQNFSRDQAEAQLEFEIRETLELNKKDPIPSFMQDAIDDAIFAIFGATFGQNFFPGGRQDTGVGAETPEQVRGTF